MFYIEKPPPEVSSFIPARFTLVPLPSCQPRLAQHHRLLLLSIPSVFSVLLSFFFLPSFSDTPRGTSSFYTRFIFFFFDHKHAFFVWAASAVVPHQPGEEKHPSTTTRRRQGANTATPILTPTVSLRFRIFSMSARFSSLVAFVLPCLCLPPLASSSSGKYQQGPGCWRPPCHLDHISAGECPTTHIYHQYKEPIGLYQHALYFNAVDMHGEGVALLSPSKQIWPTLCRFDMQESYLLDLVCCYGARSVL